MVRRENFSISHNFFLFRTLRFYSRPSRFLLKPLGFYSKPSMIGTLPPVLSESTFSMHALFEFETFQRVLWSLEIEKKNLDA